MVTKDGALKILDFGLAKLLKEQPDQVTNAPTAQATQAGTVMGTVGYMSPEQASGRPLDFRTDQFSMGSILYEMATGKRAFQRGTQAETLTAIIREDTEPVAQLNAAVPAPFRWIVERCLQKDPEERYASTRDLARDVRAVREHLSEAHVSGVVSGATAAAAVRPKRRWLSAVRRRRRSRGGVRGRGGGSGGASPARHRPPTSRSPSAAARSGGALRSGRPDDRLQRGLGRQSPQALPEAPLEPRVAAPGAAEREPACRSRPSGEMAIAVDCRVATTPASAPARSRARR